MKATTAIFVTWVELDEFLKKMGQGDIWGRVPL